MPTVRPDEWQPVGVPSLEPAAWDVVRSEVPYSVIAGPGAGKTELLAQRALYLLQTGICLAPKRILAISYKRDAAKNLKDRLLERCGPDLASRFDSLTFDAFAKGLLERFRQALPAPWRPSPDFQMSFPRDRVEVAGFLDEVDLSVRSTGIALPGSRPAAHRFLMDWVLSRPLPEDEWLQTSWGEYAAKQWWEESLRGVDGRSRLTFPMVVRLVELLFRTNPLLQRAMQVTYGYVFMDEFQDTTGPQYDLVETLFHKSKAVLTAVGDNKQRIMGWAGALPDIFERLENDFQATRRALIYNYRSSPELVRIQHTLAWAVDQGYVPAESRAAYSHGEDPCVILEFGDPKDEARHLAHEISRLLTTEGLRPRDIAFLARQRPADYQSALTQELSKYGIELRVEAELQDLLAERLTRCMLSFLRLGSMPRSGKYWSEAYEITTAMWAQEFEDEGRDVVGTKLHELHGRMRTAMADLPNDTEGIRLILDQVVAFLGQGSLVTTYPEYQQEDYLQNILDQMSRYLSGCCQDSDNWATALDRFEGVDIIPLMSIHKSKGLEYDTVVFIGLDDQAWWNFPNEPEEGKSTFFVAFSRAKQGVLFTYCEQRGSRAKVASLYELLHSAGVESVTIS